MANAKHKALKAKTSEPKPWRGGGKESHSQMMKRTKGMNWMDAGAERAKWQYGPKHKMQSQADYKKMVDTAKAYD